MNVEVVTYNLESVRIAESCGATRVELCSNEAAGGTSPSLSLLELVKEECTIPVFVMVRPREGDFTYTIDEVKQMIKEIEAFKKAGADGIVGAALTKEGKVSTSILKRLVEAASPLPFTFHRAFDHVIDPLEAMEEIIGCGCHRILTSGQKPTALEGEQLISLLIEKAYGRIIILPGAGINPDNVLPLISVTGCVEIHLSAKKIIQRSAVLNNAINLGNQLDANAYQITDEQMLISLLEKVKIRL